MSTLIRRLWCQWRTHHEVTIRQTEHRGRQTVFIHRCQCGLVYDETIRNRTRGERKTTKQQRRIA